MRTILTLKGYRYIAASVSFLEVLVYIVGLGLVMSNLDHIQNIIAYAFGFSIGIIVGMKIEEKLALGYTVVNVTSAEYELDLPNELRNLGYGVTHYAAFGRDGSRMVMQILTPRKYERKLMDTIKNLDQKHLSLRMNLETYMVDSGLKAFVVESLKIMNQKNWKV